MLGTSASFCIIGGDDMHTMADVAKLANVSRATVSIVVNGQHEKRKIPLETCQRVWDAMKELDYHPNISARRMKDSGVFILTIALLWPSDSRLSYLDRFLHSLMQHAESAESKCEIILQGYHSGRISDSVQLIQKGSFHGVIVVGASPEDIAFIDATTFNVPIVLVNRNSEKYTTVSSNDLLLVDKALAIFSKRGFQDAAVICAKNPFSASGIRVRLFAEMARNNGIRIDNESMIWVDNSMRGGVDAAKAYMALKERPHAIFSDCDYISMGMIHECAKHHIQVPGDCEILSVGLMNDDYTRYFCPSLTTIALPIEEIAHESLLQVISLINNPAETIKHIVCNPVIHFRKSLSEL